MISGKYYSSAHRSLPVQAKKPSKNRPKWSHVCRLVEQANSRVADTGRQVGLALISREFTVLDANAVHLKRWPDLVGATCFNECNHFPQPCSWCPVDATFSDGGVHDALAASPKADSHDLEYSHIVSFPAHRDKAGRVDVAVEVVFNLTTRQKEMVDLSSRLHSFLKRLCCFVGRTRTTTFVANLLLYAAISRKGLGLDDATVLQVPVDAVPPESPVYSNVKGIHDRRNNRVPH